jgi:hypothetical protein
LPLQSVNATHALNRSAGVSNSNVFRGRSFKVLRRSVETTPYHLEPGWMISTVFPEVKEEVQRLLAESEKSEEEDDLIRPFI